MPKPKSPGTCLAVAAAVLFAGCAAPDQRAADLVPFVLPWDDASPGPTDLSDWNHTPAGKFGHVRAGPDGHLYAGDERIRFFGVNLCFGACFPEKPDAERIAARMAKFGINVVRFHHFDCHKFPRGIWMRDQAARRDFDPDSLDRLDYLIAQLKAHGIYVNLNLLVSRRFTSADDLPPEVDEVRGKANHLIAFFHDPSLDMHKDYARRLLTHRNPYTGLTYADDPCVAFVEIINENGIINYFYDTQRTPHLDRLPGAFGRAIAERWTDHLRARYASTDRLKAAWGSVDGSLEEGTVPLVPFDGFEARPEALRRDWLDFLCGLERRYFRTIAHTVRRDAGAHALVTGTTCASSAITIMSELDVIDGHVYWDNPRWRAGTWNYGGLDWSFSNQSQFACGSPGGRLRWLAMYRVAGKPYSVTEYNHSTPNVYAGEAPLFLAVFGALQDWDALYLFTYEHAAQWDTRKLIGLNINQHPTKMANMPVAAALFRRADVAPARRAVAAWLSPENERNIMLRSASRWNLANAFDLGISGDDIVRHRIQIHVGPEPDEPLPPNPVHEPTKRYASDTGQLVWDSSSPAGSVTTVNTPRTKAVLGAPAGRAFHLGPVRLAPDVAPDGACALSLVLLDGPSFDQPKRALLVATGRAANSGMNFRKVQIDEGGKKVVHYEIDGWGTPPTVVEPVRAAVTVPGPAGAVRVFALDERGQRGQEVPVEEGPAGNAVFTVGPPHATLWYEIVWP